VIALFGGIEPFVRDANQELAPFAILRIRRDSVVHGDGNREFERAQNFCEDDADAATQRGSLRRIGLGKKQCEFVAADPEGGIGSTKSFPESRRRGVQDLVAPGMAVLVIDFLKAMQIENDQAQRMSVTPCAIQFLFKSFVEEAAVVETSKRIGDRAAMQSLELVVFKNDGNTKHSGRRENIDERGLKGDRRVRSFGELDSASKNFVPQRNGLIFWNFYVREGKEKALEKLRTRRRLEAVECVCDELKISVVRTHARGYRGAGAGYHRCRPYLNCPRGEWGECDSSLKRASGVPSKSTHFRCKKTPLATASGRNHSTKMDLVSEEM
jgi:hypothetical protein